MLVILSLLVRLGCCCNKAIFGHSCCVIGFVIYANLKKFMMLLSAGEKLQIVKTEIKEWYLKVLCKCLAFEAREGLCA